MIRNFADYVSRTGGNHNNAAALMAQETVSGDKLYFPPDCMPILSTAAGQFAFDLTDKQGLEIYGDSRNFAISQGGAGGVFKLYGTSEHCWNHVHDLSINGMGVAGNAILANNLKDSVIERMRLFGLWDTPVKITGPSSLNNIIRDNRIVVDTNANASASGIEHACGTTLRVIANYFAILKSGIFAVDANGCSGFYSAANIYESLPSGVAIRTSGNSMSDCDQWWDCASMSWAVVLTANNPVTIIGAMGTTKTKVNYTNWGVDPANIVWIGK